MSGESAIRLQGISKSFGDVHANKDIFLEIRKGEILALLGENGAGKSTLMSVLAGQLQPDSGTIFLNEDPVVLDTTEKAINCGIGMVYQHFKLVEAMTVAENVFLGKSGSFRLQSKRMKQEVEDLAREYSMNVTPNALVSDLSMGEKQQVEILKLLHRRSEILIFDEPTAVLTPKEADNLFTIMKQMKESGKALVFISHKLEEVMAAADRIAILKRGEVVDRVDVDQVESTVELAKRMVGREVLLKVDREPMEPRQMVLKVRDLCQNDLHNINLEVRQGEVVGVVGVAGNGQKPLVETICGLCKPGKGEVRILGKDWKEFYKQRKWNNSLSYIAEDRQGLATCQGLSLLDNFLLTTSGGFKKGLWLQRNNARIKADKLLHDFDIRPPNLEAMAWQLSGGNLQKMVLAREFYRKPHLIVAEQPTQGLDIAATEEVWKLLLKTRDEAGILLITGDLSEALALSDRICVMFEGAIVDTFYSDDEERLEQIPQMMAGLQISN